MGIASHGERSRTIDPRSLSPILAPEASEINPPKKEKRNRLLNDCRPSGPSLKEASVERREIRWRDYYRPNLRRSPLLHSKKEFSNGEREADPSEFWVSPS